MFRNMIAADSSNNSNNEMNVFVQKKSVNSSDFKKRSTAEEFYLY